MKQSFWKIIKTIFKKQSLFLLGTTMIIATWYVNNFKVEKSNAKKEELRKMFADFNISINRFEINDTKLLQIDLSEHSSTETYFFDSLRLPIVFEQFNVINNATFAINGLRLVDDEIAKVLETIPFNDSLPKGLSALSDRYNFQKGQLIYLKYRVAWYYDAHNMLIDYGLGKFPLYASLFFIIGTLLISLNKAIEYLEITKKQSES